MSFETQEYSSSKSNIATKCRGCLMEDKESDMNSLFIKFERNTTLAKIIEESIGYVVTEEERYSDYLCKECTKIIVEFIKFKTSFQNATDYFNNLKFSQSISQNIKGANPANVEETNNDFKIFKGYETELIKETMHNENDLNYSKQCDTKNVDIGKPSVLPTSLNYQTIGSRQICKETKKINCELCNEHFRSKFQLQKHKRSTHQKNIQKKFKKQQLLKDPWKKSSNVLVSKKVCKVCKDEFSIEELYLHIESHKTHVCNTCGHRFIRKTDLIDHAETHSNVCKYVCQHCGKAFKVRTALNKHRRIHTNPREEVCDVCGQRFNTRDNLKTHYKLKHTKAKDFQCNFCGLAFALKSTLEKHIERHNPNRPRVYSCKLCNLSYINKYNLSRHHIIKHTAFENKPICKFCGKGYVKKMDLLKHLKRHHEQNGKEENSINKEREKT